MAIAFMTLCHYRQLNTDNLIFKLYETVHLFDKLV